MDEQFLYYVWQQGLMDKKRLRTINGESVEVIHPGRRNEGSGPDFRDARLRIGDKLWAGHVEIHLRSSDWFAHHHETDPAYDPVILHVVYEYDMPVFNTRNVEIPALEIREVIYPGVYDAYRRLHLSAHPLRCHGQTGLLPAEQRDLWIEKLFVERLREKTEYFSRLLDRSLQDWEGVLYTMLLRYFGMPVNTEVFEQIAQRLPFSVFRKYLDNLTRLEALLFGTARLLPPQAPDAYTRTLLDEYAFLAAKHRLKAVDKAPVFGRMRPQNFPTVRLAQLAKLYHDHPRLFTELFHSREDFHWPVILRTATSPYWETRYRPGQTSAKRRKTTGKNFIEKLIINVLIPVQFAYEQHYGEPDADRLIDMARRLAPEHNRITRLFEKEGLPHPDALHSQAYLRLFKHYCTQNRCTSCPFGHHILRSAGDNSGV